MTVIWRDAARADLGAIIALIREDARTAADEGADMDRLDAAFSSIEARDDAFLVVGVEGETVIATYQLFIIEAVSISAPRRGHVEDVRVVGARRGRGVGTALMADAEARARAAGATLMQLMSSQTRTTSHEFYSRLGYMPSHLGFKKRL